MTPAQPSTIAASVPPLLCDALTFDAPYVAERLANDRIVDSVAEGRELFAEVLKYLVLSELNREVIVGMFSVRVDEAWHSFILYTSQYTDFCQRYFGRYIGHAPKNAPTVPDENPLDRPELTFDGFRERYEILFSEPLPDVWYDARSIGPTRRVFNDAAGRMSVARHGPVAELLDESGGVVLSADEIAYQALLFIAHTGAFYVRELPGALSDDEKVALVKTLTSWGLLRIAA